MAMQEWEMRQREKGNVAGAEMARTLREQFGDVPLPQQPVEQTVFAKPEALSQEQVTEELERLAVLYQEREFHKHKAVKVTAGKMKDMIVGLAEPQPEAFRGRFDIPIVGFGQIPPEDQAKLAGVDYYLGGTNHRDWESDPQGYKTTSGLYMTWMHDGEVNLNKRPTDVRVTLAPDARGATEYDGIGLYVARPQVLSNHYFDLPGTQVGSGGVPCLELFRGRPRMSGYWGGVADPGFGSAVAGRNKS